MKERRQKCGINVDSLQYYYDVVPWADIPVHVVFIIKGRACQCLQSSPQRGQISPQSFVQLAARTGATKRNSENMVI